MHILSYDVELAFSPVVAVVYLLLLLLLLFLILFLPLFFLPFLMPQPQLGHHLVGLVVKASASRAEDPGFESRLLRDFSGVESY